MMQLRSTTVIAVRRDGRVALASDGQVTQGNTVLKTRARKVQRLRGGKVLAGFAGSTADSLALTERFEEKLDAFGLEIIYYFRLFCFLNSSTIGACASSAGCQRPALIKSLIGSGTVPGAGGAGGLFGPLTPQA